MAFDRGDAARRPTNTAVFISRGPFKQVQTMSLVQIGALTLVAVLGVALTYFGYESAQAILGFGGLAAGAAAGGWAGFVVIPRVVGASLSGAELVGIAGAALVIGAIIGQALIPNLGRFAIMFLGFTFSTLAALVLLSGGAVVEIVTQTFPQAIDQRQPELLFDRFDDLTFIGDLDPAIGGAIALFIGVTGGGLVRKKLDLVMALLVTIVGAIVLAAVVPLLVGAAEVDEQTVVGSFSIWWFGLFAVTGALFEIARYYDELGVAALFD